MRRGEGAAVSLAPSPGFRRYGERLTSQHKRSKQTTEPERRHGGHRASGGAVKRQETERSDAAASGAATPSRRPITAGRYLRVVRFMAGWLSTSVRLRCPSLVAHSAGPATSTSAEHPPPRLLSSPLSLTNSAPSLLLTFLSSLLPLSLLPPLPSFSPSLLARAHTRSVGYVGNYDNGSRWVQLSVCARAGRVCARYIVATQTPSSPRAPFDLGLFPSARAGVLI